MGKRLFNIALVVVTVVYCILLILDIPFIRGIYDPIFPSNWPYYYVPTWERIWLPIVCFLLLLGLFYYGYIHIKKWSTYRKIIYFMTFIILVFALQISYVYFSRFGVTVLFQRIVNPGMNGYFSSAVRIDTHEYVTHFSEVIESLDQHARDHPPGSVLFIKAFIGGVKIFNITDIVFPHIPTPNGDVKMYWDQLNNDERVSAILLAFLYHFIASVTGLFMYIIARLFYDEKKSLNLMFLGSLIPSVSFFALKFDPFYFLLFLASMYVVLLGIKKQSTHLYFFFGILVSLNLFFSYSVLPAYAVLGLFSILRFKNNFRLFVNFLLHVLNGALCFTLLQTLFGYNIFFSFVPTIANQAPRSYLPWLLYNPFDFFQYFGVSLSLLFFGSFIFLKSRVSGEKYLLTLAFYVIFIGLIISGISRAEVGRIWMPLMIFPLILSGGSNKFAIQTVILVGVLLFIQNIIMTEFWVPVW